MKYYCVLQTIVNFENFIDTFDRLLSKIWKFWKFLIKFVKNYQKFEFSVAQRTLK